MPDHEVTLRIDQLDRVRAQNERGGETSGRIDSDQIRTKVIGLFDRWTRTGKLIEPREFEVFGALLWESLVPAEISQFLDEALERARADDATLRIQLTFSNQARHLASLPWEYLYRPDEETRDGFFLATTRDLVLSRYLPLKYDRENLAAKEAPLRLLVAISTPVDLGPVITGKPLEAIQRLQAALGAQITVLEKPTVYSLIEAIENTCPHVVHMMGHGRFDRERAAGAVALHDDDLEQARWVEDGMFAEMVTETQVIPRLFVLHLCDGAAVDFDESFAGVAPQLVRSKIPAVVAMQYRITNKAAVTFIDSFYRSLAGGSPIDIAVQRARFRLRIGDPDAGVRDAGIPVLYLRSRDGVLEPPGDGAAREVGGEP